MFREILRDTHGKLLDWNVLTNQPQYDNLLCSHPMIIAAMMEQVWYGRDMLLPGSAPLPAMPLCSANFTGNPVYLQEPTQYSVPIPHLIYAYMVENTRIYDIFRRVILECTPGERLQAGSIKGQGGLRASEELFFRDPPPFFAFALTSELRPDPNATRRNAYYRMFGLDLNHGADDNKPYPYVKPAAANREFIPTLEALLTEVWRGIVNARNTSGARDTDDEAIATLCLRLQDMLTVRRQWGTLSREEFWFTAMMSWFHLTVGYDSPIVSDLKATATSPEERLRKLGEKVGIPSHAKSQAFFLLSDELSLFLRNVETGSYSNAGTVPALYNALQQDMERIITQYSVATGRDLKARAVVMTTRAGRTTLAA